MVSKDWLRPFLYLAFVIVFANVMYNSLSKLYAENTAFIQEQKTAPAMDYPSVTMCPSTYGDQFRQHADDVLDLKMKDLLLEFSHGYEEGNRYT